MSETAIRLPWFADEGGVFGPISLRRGWDTLSPERTEREVTFVEGVIGLRAQDAVLDVPCGYGRHAIEFAKRGYAVTGFELSRTLIAEARRVAEELGVSLRLDQGDMRHLPYAHRFDAAVNLFTSLGYFDDDRDDCRFMAGVSRALKNNGRFLIDFTNKDWIVGNFSTGETQTLSDGTVLVISRSFDTGKARLIERHTRTSTNGSTSSVSSSLRLYTASELALMGEDVGLRLIWAGGDLRGGRLKSDSRRTVLLFQKAD